MNWLEQKYINLISNRLDRYTRKGPDLYNFRCHVCGDSHTNKFKTRGYLYNKGGKTLFHCHNCSITLSFDRFLKSVDEAIYFDYILENRLEMKQYTSPKVIEPPIIIPDTPFATLKTIAKLKEEHPAKQYVISRQIPTSFHHRLYYAPKFSHWVNTLVPDKLDEKYEEPRLVIPFSDFDGTVFGFQGRDFRKIKTPTRYMTIMFDKGRPNCYGLDRLDLKKQIYCFEGPIDSMFIRNSVASFGGIIHRDVKDGGLPVELITVVYDNERRSKETVSKMNRALANDFAVCIWPDTIIQKDVNELVLSKVKTTGFVDDGKVEKVTNEVKQMIDANTFRGIEGKLRLDQWKRIGND